MALAVSTFFFEEDLFGELELFLSFLSRLLFFFLLLLDFVRVSVGFSGTGDVVDMAVYARAPVHCVSPKKT